MEGRASETCHPQKPPRTSSSHRAACFPAPMASLFPFQSTADMGTLFDKLVARIGGTLSGASILGGLVALIALRLALRRKSVLEDVNGPPAESWLYGNMLQLMFPPSFGTYDFPWQERYGLLYRFKGCFGENRLMVSDATALHHILHSPTLFMHGPVIDNASHLVHGSKAIVTYHGRLLKPITPTQILMNSFRSH
ncbi:hypothetical protein HMN09_00213500 [Mycena chlorophos]|uniref:Cytochrome P450 n=1 Tax=Mycena chlorophos TaxID=658473 RepID=A0A8H6TQG1_MYCCL|nr:hypothetical protein HMN09_00213500 [Mycena chlorophos]